MQQSKIFRHGELCDLPALNNQAELFAAEGGAYWLNVVNKDHAPEMIAEMHAEEADIYMALSGEGTLLLGGTLRDSSLPSPGQYRGSDLDGAESFTLAAGDVVIIPAGTPHMLDLRDSSLTYVVVKIKHFF